MTRFLECHQMTGGYGKTDILHDCTIAADRGQITVIVGPNGAGKSTAMRAVFGMIALRSGRVMVNGRDITALSPQARVTLGMGFVPQTHNIFPSLSVHENLEMGGFLLRQDVDTAIADVYDLFPILAQKRHRRAGVLSGGQRQQLAVGRAMMTRPDLLLLDEPTAGIAPKVIDDLFARIVTIARNGVCVVMVEQNARQALAIADFGYVLVQGRNKFHDVGANLLANADVRQAFLGG